MPRQFFFEIENQMRLGIKRKLAYARDIDERHGFSGMDRVERAKAMRQKAWAFMRDHPDRVIELMGTRFLRFWRPWPYAPDYKTPVTVVASLLVLGRPLFREIDRAFALDDRAPTT